MRYLLMTVCLVSLSSQVSLAEEDDVAKLRSLVPYASAMKQTDFTKLAASARPREIEDRSLTLQILATKTADATPAQLKEFRYLDGVPKPSQLVDEIHRVAVSLLGKRVLKGPVTIIHADRITDFTAKIEGNEATGVVSFHVPKLYEGKVNYRAKKNEENWRIIEFHLPANDIHIERSKPDSNVWSDILMPAVPAP